MDMDELFRARTAIENAFCDEARSSNPHNADIARENAVICGGLPFTTAKESSIGFPRNVIVIFHWGNCQTLMRGFTLEMYDRAEKWLNSLREM